MKRIALQPRLRLLAEMTPSGGRLADIGTDHGYLPVWLLQEGRIPSAIASDVGAEPLEHARRTAEEYETQGLDFRLCDGLSGIEPEETDTVVIAGMGGETIAEIISGTQWLKSGVNLVLQPMTRAGYLRKWLYKNGFEIAEEKAVIQDRFIYTAIRAFYSGYKFNIGKVTEITGRINIETDAGMKYCQNQLSKINNIAMGLSKAGKTEDSQEYQRIAERLTIMMEGKMNLVSEIYTYIDSFAPFSAQEKWDNSGLLTGSMNKKVSKVLVTLDITNEVADEAAEIGAELIIAHHPVIFKPLYSLSENEPSCKLLKSGISAICVHTPYDVAEGGMSDILMNLVGFEKSEGILEITGQRNKSYGFGTIGVASQEYQADELAKKLKNILGCTVVRYTDGGKPIKKAAFCTGSGGNLIEAALNQGADAYITSEVKHDQWLLAKQRGISVFDCGHFHTENIGMIRLCKMLAADFSNIEFVMSEVNKDPVKYVL